MIDVKITKLCTYLNEQGYKHCKGKNISSDIKSKIYEAYIEKNKSMSQNKFCNYLSKFGLIRSSITNIISSGKKAVLQDPLTLAFWENLEEHNYSKRYLNSSRKKKLVSFSDIQIGYIKKLREYEPNKGYKLFENGLFIPEKRNEFDAIFGKSFSLSKRQFYAIISQENISHRITKRKKRSLIREHKAKNTIETYLAGMHHVYGGYKALHRWQVDIKYLTDIPNYIALGVFDIFLYEITFRDYKTGLTMVFFGDDRSKSSVFTSFEIFEKLMINIGINLKNITFQFDGGAEFSNLRINGVKGDLIEMIEDKFGGYRLIDRKEQNGHVETFHRRIEEDLFDTKYISDLKLKVDNGELNKNKLKSEILKLLNQYTLNFNKYWYSSYEPRYELFGKKSPLDITKDDWNNEIKEGKIDLVYIEKYFGAYDVSKSYTMFRKQDYSHVVNSIILLNENKFDLAVNSIKMIDNNYLIQLTEFIDTPTGQIGTGRYTIFYFSLDFIIFIVTIYKYGVLLHIMIILIGNFLHLTK